MLRFLFNRALRRSRLVASSILFGALTGILAALVVPLVLSARAHEDHDHGPAEAIAGQLAPRVAARSELFELVGILRGERLVIYLDRFASNEPVTSADIAVMIGDTTEPVNAERSAQGSYTLVSPRFKAAGPIELVFSITGEAGEDLLAGTLTLPSDTAAAPPGASAIGTAHLAFVADAAADRCDGSAWLIWRLPPAPALFRAGRSHGADGDRRYRASVRDGSRAWQ